MKTIFLWVVFFWTGSLFFSQAIAQQGAVLIQENFLNQNSFFVNGKEIDLVEMENYLALYPDIQKKFMKGTSQMNGGLLLLVAGASIPAGGLVYFLINHHDPNSWKVPMYTSFISLPLSGLGHFFRVFGKRNVNQSIQTFNVLHTAPGSRSPEVAFGLGQYGLGLTLRF